MRRDTIFRIASMTKPITAAGGDDPGGGVQPAAGRAGGSAAARAGRPQGAAQLDGPLDDTVPANRPITLRDLLTFRLGYGAILAPPDQYPIQQAMVEAGVAAGPNPPTLPRRRAS